MIKSSFLVSVILAAAAPACHHDRPVASPATAERDSSGMTATAEPGNTGNPSNSDNTSNSDNSNATSPGATVPGHPQPPLINDPDRTGSPQPPSASGTPTDNGSATGSEPGNAPDTTVPTSAKDAGSGSNTGTGNGSNTTRRDRGSNGRTRNGSNGNGSGSGSSDGSNGSGSDLPH